MTPYGYKIVNGQAEIEEEKACDVRTLFEGYVSGLGLKAAAEKAGLHIYHGSVGIMLRNKRYLGDDFYPPIIEKELFDKAEEIRVERAKRLGRVRVLEKSPKPLPETKFRMREATMTFSNPFEKAEYVYSLIESEVR